MHEVYIYDAGSQNFDGIGLVGALDALSCTHSEAAGGNSEVSLEHPFDELGKWSYLQEGRILKCWVPVRETPLLKMDESAAQTITREVFKVVTEGGRLHLRQKPNTSAKILARYNPGAEVVKLADAGTSNGYKWYQVSVVKDGSTGYMAATYLQYVRSYTETTAGDSGGVTVGSTDEAGVANWTVRPQLFEIYRKEAGDEGIVVYARHITYKLLKNVTSYASSGETTLQTALNGILGNCRAAHDFKAYTDITDTRSDLSWRLVNPIKAMLDAEEGVIAKWGCQLIRDNWNLFFLKRAGGYRGMRIEYGKNLVGVDCNIDISDVATRIIPVGRNKDGTDLFLPEEYIDSPNVELYNEPLIYVLECSDCKVGTDDLTIDGAYAKMREKANALIENGCDQPTVSMSVDFVSLGDSEEYAQFREMDKLFLYDEVDIVTQRGYADARAQVTELVWDCLNDRAVGIGVGSIAASLSTSRLTSWQIPSGINGGKLSYGTVGAAQLGADAISARHIQSDSINTGALQAGAVTAEKIAAGVIAAEAVKAVRADINKIVAGEITTDQLYVDLATVAVASIGSADIDWAEIESLTAQVAEIVDAKIESADIDWANIATLNAQIAAVAEAKIQDAKITVAQIDQLDAAVAKIVSATIATGDFDLAAIKNLLANAFVLEQGIADSIYIKNLAVTAANLLSATLGELVLKGSDGRYYKIVVGSDGSISTRVTTVTSSEISAGQTTGGQMIVETTANIADLNATTIKGSQAILNAILTESLTAGKITAGQALIASATIPTLYVTSVQAIGNSIDFSANESIRLMVAEKTTVYRQETPPTGANPGDLWVKTSTNYFYQVVGAADGAPEFYLSDDGYLVYRYEDGETVYPLTIDENGWLSIDENSPFVWAAAEDGTLTAWARVKDADLTAAELKITDNAIIATVTSSTEFKNIQSSINQNAAAIELRVTSEQLKKSGVTIEEDEVSIISDNFTLQLLDPNDNETVLMEMSASGSGGFKQLYAEKIYSPSVVSTYDEATITVASAVELETLLADLSNKFLTGVVTIVISNVTSGNYELFGVSGPGCVRIRGGSANAAIGTINSLKVTRCASRVEILWTNFTTSGTALTVDASNVRIGRCVFNALNGVRAEYGAKVEALYCSGVCTGYVAEAAYGSDVYFTGSTIPQGLPKVSGTGNIYTAIAFAPVPSEEEPEELPTITTLTLKPTLTKTYRGSGWRDTYYLWQGRYGTASLSRGCMWFDTSAFADKTILSATLRLTRMTGSGAGVFVTTNIYGTTTADAGGTSAPAIGTKYASVDLDQGQTKTVDVTNAIAALAAGAIKGLMLYDSSTTNLSASSPYTRHYAKFYGYDHASSPLLTVTYK